MTNEDRQRSALMAQLAKKRALKEKYLRPKQGAEHTLTDLVMTNAMLLAIRDREDLFGLIRRICMESPETTDLDGAMGWVQALADGLGCGAYELFLDDAAKRRRIVEKLLAGLTTCDSWDNIRQDERGGGFALPGFDYAWRMASKPRATLIFDRQEGEYTLALAAPANPGDPIPSQAVLWQEGEGVLQSFIDRVLSEQNNGWTELKAAFDDIAGRILAQAETLKDLTVLLAQLPGGGAVRTVLTRQVQSLTALRQEMLELYRSMPEAMRAGQRGARVQNALILVGGAAQTLEKLAQTMPEDPAAALEEVVCLLESAGEPL